MKQQRYIEVPRVEVDRFLRGLGYAPDTPEDMRTSTREVTYSKYTTKFYTPTTGKYVVSPAFERDGRMQFSGHHQVVEAKTLQEVVDSSLQVALVKSLDAYHDKARGRPGLAIVVPKPGVEWVITQHMEPAGSLLVRVYTSISANEDVTRDVGTDAIRVSVLYDANGFIRGVDHHQRVYRTGTVAGVLERLGRRIQAAEALQLTACSRCGSPAFRDSGRCVIPECRQNGGKALLS